VRIAVRNPVRSARPTGLGSGGEGTRRPVSGHKVPAHLQTGTPLWRRYTRPVSGRKVPAHSRGEGACKLPGCQFLHIPFLPRPRRAQREPPRGGLVWQKPAHLPSKLTSPLSRKGRPLFVHAGRCVQEGRQLRLEALRAAWTGRARRAELQNYQLLKVESESEKLKVES